MSEILSSLAATAGSPASRTHASAGSPTRADAAEPGFAARLASSLRSADEAHHAAEQRVRELARGEGDVVETMVALSKADLSLRLAVNLRNRALEAYHEIMRLPV